MTTLKFRKAASLSTSSEALVLFFYSDQKSLSAEVKELDKKLGGLLSRLRDSSDFSGAVENLASQQLDPKLCGASLLVLVGLGETKKCNAQALRRSGSAIYSRLSASNKSADIALDGLKVEVEALEASIQALVEGFELSAYRFDKFKAGTKPKLSSWTLLTGDDALLKAAKKAGKVGQTIAAGVAQARDLANLPGNHGRPKILAAAAKAMAKKSGLTAKALGRNEMQKLGMGSLLSVSLGSPHEPQLIVLEHKTTKKNAKTVCLVGKGLTFDSGGISIKPSADMDKMRYDKCGGTTVIGTMKAVAELKLPINVIGIVPSSENMPGGDANKPGDVVTASNKKTIEILNTDAEGRLILADALVYSKRFNPDVVIDLATLTGACMIALGQHASGLMTRDDELARLLVHAGERSFERTWRLPLWDEYSEEMKGQTTDLKNLGGRYGGAITAGAFLENFVEKGRWAHLDIAGVSWDDSNRNYNKGKGATGYGVRLLVEFLRNFS